MGKNVNICVDAKKSLGVQDHLWRYIGYDECNYSYIPEGRTLLKKFAALEEKPCYVRTHFMLCTGNCHGTYKFGSTNIYWEDENGDPVYDFTYFDMIIDSILDCGDLPFIEIGFMPLALADRSYFPENAGYGYYKDQGWAAPPKDYDKWYGLIEAIALHLKEKHGEEAVNRWYFELWNEPDIFYFKGTASEYCKLFDYTEAALHAVLPDARLAGPAATGPFEGNHSYELMDAFFQHCSGGVNFRTGAVGTRLDFITYHAKGGGFNFEMHAKKEVPSVESLLYQIRLGMDLAVKYGYRDREIVLSEADPDGWAAGGFYDNENMIFRNTEYYASYVASSYEKIDELAHEYGMTVRPLAWAFMFPGERMFEGTRTFSTQGVNKPVFNLFRLYGMLGDEKLAFLSDGARGIKEAYGSQPVPKGIRYTGEGEETDVSGFAVRGADGETQILVYSHNNDRDKAEMTGVTLKVEGLSADSVQVTEYRIDPDHSNARKAWIEAGKPLFPDGAEYEKIKAADELSCMMKDQNCSVENGTLTIQETVPAHSVSLFIIH